VLSIVPFSAKDLEALRPNMGDRAVSKEQVEALENEKYSYTLMNDGKVVACAGVIEWWTGRGEGWMFIGPHTFQELLFFYRAVKRFFAACPFRRVEAVVEVDFPEAHQWVLNFGFKFEGRLSRYAPDGDDMSLYAFIRESH
jgi:hypothetical protein